MVKEKLTRRDLAAMALASASPVWAQPGPAKDAQARVQEDLRRSLESIRQRALPAEAEPATIFRP